MAGIGRTVATLRFFGDDLDPDELTRLLGAAPTESGRKGEFRTGRRASVYRTSQWRMSVGDREPGDLDGQIAEMLNRLTSDLAVWADLTGRFSADVFCGLFMEGSNEGLELTPGTLAALGARGLTLGLDIYDPIEDAGDS